MSGWSQCQGSAVVIDLENVDTDQIIPARFMSTPRSEGYGQFLFHDLRQRDKNGPITPLDRAKDARILISGRNFGCGSSREAAVYALVDHGLCAVVAPSFGDIFAANAINNGLLPAVVEAEIVTDLITRIGDRSEIAEINVTEARLNVLGDRIRFSLEPSAREKLINGWDDIDLTRAYTPEIESYRAARATDFPWIFAAEEHVEQHQNEDGAKRSASGLATG